MPELHFSPTIIAAAHALNQHYASELSPTTLDRFADLVSCAAYARFLVELDDEALEGFLIAFDQTSNYDGENFEWFKSRFDHFLYVDRIVVAPWAQGRGIARNLYDDVFDWARKQGHTRVTCEVNLVPPNRASTALHASLGFREIGQAVLNSGGKTVSYLMRDVAPTPLPPGKAR